MRVILWIALVAGGIAMGAGLFHYAELRPQLPHTPAIVLMPQIIQAVTSVGFGALIATFAAGILALLELGDRHSEALAVPARTLNPASAERGPADPPRPTSDRGLPIDRKKCPCCAALNQLNARTCIICGTTIDMATP